ncbi:MAG: hypothetical protein AAFQ34_14100 [Pseudomonadota bacterium]
MTQAKTLLESYKITDGYLFELVVFPSSITLRCSFSTFENGEWTSTPVEIKLDQPRSTALEFNLPEAFAGTESSDMGDFYLIEAGGSLSNATFHLQTTFGKITVGSCKLSINPWELPEYLQ